MSDLALAAIIATVERAAELRRSIGYSENRNSELVDAVVLDSLAAALKEGKVIRGEKDKRGNKPIALLVIPWEKA